MTTRICVTASLRDGASAADRGYVCEALGRLEDAVPEIVHSHAALHLEGSLGAGELTWDFAVSDADSIEELGRRLESDGWKGLFRQAEPGDRDVSGLLCQIEAWQIAPLASSVPSRELVGIKRTNLVRVLDSADAEAVARWSREVVALPDHVPAIRNWSLARVQAFGPSMPRVPWTHAWEQELETLEGLVMDYMASPYHWGWIDGWYDPEMPRCIMDPDLAHLYGRATRNVLGWTAPHDAATG